MRSVEDEIQETAMTGDKVKEIVAEMIPPATLFSDEVIALPAFHRSLRDWLDRHGANLQQHHSRRVIMTLATDLYLDPEDREAAEEMAKVVVARGRKGPSGPADTTDEAPRSLSGSSSAAPTRDQETSVAHKIAMRFKEQKQKFSGALGEFFNDFVSDYLQASRDYDLSPKQKLQFMHNLFTGDAKRFYYHRVDGYATGFSQAVEMIEREYNSVVRKDRCKNYLSTLRLAKFVEEGTEISAALEKTYKVITKLAPQVPRSHQGEAHKVEFLRKAVIGYPWATEPLSRIATHDLTFQMLYGELESALHLEKESQLARIRDKVSTTRVKEEVPGVLYQSQGRYLNKHVGITRRPQNFHDQRHSHHGAHQPSIDCFNCGGDHPMRKCDKPMNFARAAQRRMEWYAKKKGSQVPAHKVLFELCSQLDPDMENQEQLDPDPQPDESTEEEHGNLEDALAFLEVPDSESTCDITDLNPTYPVFPLRD